ncbi:unnamed protein product [Caenorhabditis brenneri]
MAPRVQQSINVSLKKSIPNTIFVLQKKSSVQTEKRVTRSQTTRDPTLDLHPASVQPQSILRRNKPRNVNQPWINIVVKELLAREPNMNRVAAMKKAGKLIKTATDQEKERWRKLAEKPRRRLTISANVQVKVISPRANKNK